MPCREKRIKNKRLGLIVKFKSLSISRLVAIFVVGWDECRDVSRVLGDGRDG
jgi:hypothetical protein